MDRLWVRSLSDYLHGYYSTATLRRYRLRQLRRSGLSTAATGQAITLEPFSVHNSAQDCTNDALGDLEKGIVDAGALLGLGFVRR